MKTQNARLNGSNEGPNSPESSVQSPESGDEVGPRTRTRTRTTSAEVEPWPERQCGKTTLLTVLSELVNRPVVSSNVSPPALFRAIEELRPTLLIDEADTFLKGNDEFRGILNAGYTRKTAFVLRVANQAVQ